MQQHTGGRQGEWEESQEGTLQVTGSLQVSPSGYMDAVQVPSYQLLIWVFFNMLIDVQCPWSVELSKWTDPWVHGLILFFTHSYMFILSHIYIYL